MKKIITLFAIALCFSLKPTFAQVYPFVDGFDTYSAFNAPPGYITADIFGYFITEPSTGVVGNSIVSVMSSSNPGDSVATPIIGATTSGNILVSFYYKVANSSGTAGLQFPLNDGLRVYYYNMTDTTINIPIATIDSTNHTLSSAYVKKTYAVSVPSGSNIRVKFKTNHSNPNAGSLTYYVRLDSVVVKDDPSANGIGNSSTDGGKVNVYPNPANDFVTVQTSSFAVSSYEVYNVLGSRVIAKTIAASASNNNFTINTSSLNKGKYFIVLHNSKDNTTARKMVVIE